MIYGFLRQIRAFRFPSSTRLAALATALALGSILWACSTPTDTESMADEQAVATQTPAADLAALLDTIGPEVAKLRGLREWDVPAHLLTREMLAEKLESEFADDYPAEEAELDQLEWELLGILRPGQDIVELQKNLLTGEIIGFYDSESEEMFAIGDDSTPVPLLIWTLAHEYVHALQDRTFDLDAIEESIGETNQDALLAFRALVEGDASIAGAQYAITSLSREEINALASTGDSPGDAFLSAPRALREILLFPYQAGSDYISSLLPGGWSAVDDAYTRPPLSTEQVMHPEKYQENEQPLEVDLPNVTAVLSPGWEEMRRNAIGEFFIRVLLEHGIDTRAAHLAAEGWGGDAYALYRNELGQGLMTMKFRWDADSDLDEFWTALLAFLAGGGLGPGSAEADETIARWSGEDRTASAHRLAGSVVLIIGHDAQAVSLAANLLSRG